MPAPVTIGKLVRGIAFNVLLYGVLVFVPAGTLHWWRAWVLLGVVLVASTWSSAALYRAKTGILEERFQPPFQKDQPLVDKVVLAVLLITYLGAIVFTPLDVFHFHLLLRPGLIVSSLGLLLFIAGWWMMTLAMLANAFAAPVVKHQAERAHHVVDTGVYRFVRHPMYSACLPLMVGMPLWLESYTGALLALLPIATLAVRIRIEERFLLEALPGYEDYRHRVRYRLIPGVW
jgi:protein-S-isoprenylcysteine O-methyltransferase Ste14